MSDNMENKTNAAEPEKEQQYSLNDDRRVKVLSPGAMVAKRFFRNRIAVVGLCILAFMFIFSFIGGIISPYREDQQFYRNDILNKEYAGAAKNEEFRYTSADGQIGFILDGIDLVLAASCGKCQKCSAKDQSIWFCFHHFCLLLIAKRPMKVIMPLRSSSSKPSW